MSDQAPEWVWLAKCHPFKGDNFYVSDGSDKSAIKYVRADSVTRLIEEAVQAGSK